MISSFRNIAIITQITNNIKTIIWDENYEVKNKINQQTLDNLIDKICKSLNYVKRKIGRSVDE